MLHTFLTNQWGLRYPIIGAPMAGIAHGRLARAISQAGGLGMIGVGSATPAELIAREAAVVRGDDENMRFGVGLMAWALATRPELLDATIKARPFLVSVSFGGLAPYVERLHVAGIHVATQVNTVEMARVADDAGVDLIVAQGTEAGGHTGQVGALPLLQAVLEAVSVPVVAAGGIATARGLAAALAAGAEGAWLGTAFLASPESEATEEARRRVVAAHADETVLTSVFDRAQRLAWPARFPGRALRNSFADRWHGRDDELSRDDAAPDQLRRARATGDYDVAYIYAGEAVGLIDAERAAGDIVRTLGDGAEELLGSRYRHLFGNQ